MSQFKRESRDVIPEVMVEETLMNIKDGSMPHNKAFFIALNDREDKYYLTWRNAGLSTTEVISLLECVKQEMLDCMRRAKQ
jgi:hypothetical protein